MTAKFLPLPLPPATKIDHAFASVRCCVPPRMVSVALDTSSHPSVEPDIIGRKRMSLRAVRLPLVDVRCAAGRQFGGMYGPRDWRDMLRVTAALIPAYVMQLAAYGNRPNKHLIRGAMRGDHSATAGQSDHTISASVGTSPEPTARSMVYRDTVQKSFRKCFRLVHRYNITIHLRASKGFAKWKTQFRSGGALNNWTARQLAVSSQSSI